MHEEIKERLGLVLAATTTLHVNTYLCTFIDQHLYINTFKMSALLLYEIFVIYPRQSTEYLLSIETV